MRNVLRDVQCRISALAIVANFVEVSAPGVQKRISCIRQSRAWVGDDASQVGSFNRQSGASAGTQCSAKLQPPTNANAGEWGECYWRGSVVRESEMPVRGRCCGDSSQAADEPMSALAVSFQ